MADHTSTQAHGNVDVGAETAMDQLARSSPPAPEKTRREKSGTVWTATAHIVALLIGSSVLAVAWTFAQLGWVAGPAVVVSLSVVTYYSSALLADCYRDDDPDHLGGAVHGEYIGAVRSYLGPKSVTFCGIIQYGVLWAAMVAYTITSSSSMSAVQRVNRFHRSWLDASDGDGGTTGVRYMVVFGAFQLLLSQLPSLENVAWLSVIAVATSFGYSSICLGLCAAKWASHHGGVRGTLAGAAADSPGEKVFNVLLAVGNIAISYIYSPVLFEIQDTVRTPPSESKTMKKASLYGLAVSAVFYLLLGVSGYAAFGNDAPSNILTGAAFHEPFWLVDVANACVVVHFLGAYQVIAQPVFARLEAYVGGRWPESRLVTASYELRLRVPAWTSATTAVTLLPAKMALRSAVIVATTAVATMMPFFNAVLGFIAALGFWPLAVYLPVSMHIARVKIRRGEARWWALQGASMALLVVAVGMGVASVRDMVQRLNEAAPFQATD
uniref:Amino acid transporter transmembrane domain-containing protein n=1 Tax=Oryza punctata TaxID=4537 RepID=A0A0E0L9L8_ORYPU